jgi:hypothetical protein
LALAAAACGGSAQTSDTKVARNEPVRTGNVDYDDYFEDVSNLRAMSLKAPEDEKNARAPVAKALGTDLAVERVLQAFRAKAEELAGGKAKIHFFFFGLDEQGKPVPNKKIQVVAISVMKQIPKDVKELAAAMEQSAINETQIVDAYSIVPEKGRRLEAKATTLRTSVPTEFPQLSKDKRNQIERELTAAQQLSGQIATDCQKVVGDAQRFLKESSQIAVAAATVENKETAPAPPPRGRPKSKTLHGAPAPAPAAAPAPPPPAAAADRPPPARAPKPAPKEAPPPPKKRAAPAAAPAEPAPKAPDFNP